MLKKITLLVLSLGLFTACEISERNSNSCPVIIGVPTTAVTGPTETTVNTTITLEVSYKTKKNCGGFSSFYKNPSSNPLVEIITVNTYYDACACDQVESIDKRDFSFKKSTPGVYVVKFKKTNEEFIEHTVTVE
jgi:hypothetical protein